MKRGKNAQITIFVILSILIVIGFLIFFLIRSETQKELLDPQFVDLYPFVEECMQTVGEEGLVHIGNTGGYYLQSKNSNHVGIAYHFDKGISLLPSKRDIENELSNYMSERLFFCTKNFVNFEDIDVEQGDIETKTYILSGKIRFDVKYPLKIKKGNLVSHIESFEKEIPSRLNTLHNILSSINREQMNNPEQICITCIQRISANNEVLITMNPDPYDSDTILFKIIDGKIKLNGDYYKFYFAHKYRK